MEKIDGIYDKVVGNSKYDLYIDELVMIWNGGESQSHSEHMLITTKIYNKLTIERAYWVSYARIRIVGYVGATVKDTIFNKNTSNTEYEYNLEFDISEYDSICIYIENQRGGALYGLGFKC